MTLSTDLQARARRRYAQVARKRRDPRYRRVLGRLKAARLLITNEDVPEHRDPITVGDALWAGAVEPRILELLPALIVKKPSLFSEVTSLPADVGEVVRAIRRGEVPPALRGVDGAALMRWVPRIGHRGKRPSRAKTLRLTPEDDALLRELSHELGLSESDTVRHGLRALARDLKSRDR
jgi:hypothetical protein